MYCISVVSMEMKGLYYDFGSCWKVECLDWLKIHFPASSGVF